MINRLGISCEAELMTVRKESGEVVETGYLITYKGAKALTELEPCVMLNQFPVF